MPKLLQRIYTEKLLTISKKSTSNKSETKPKTKKEKRLQKKC